MGVKAAADAGAFSVGGVAWGTLGAVLLVAILRALRVFRPN